MHTEKRRRPDLKVKRRDKDLFSPPQSTYTAINDDCIIISPEKQHYNTIPSHTMKILYSSIYQKDNKIQLPKSKFLKTEKKQKIFHSPADNTSISLPPPNYKLLTRQPLHSLEFETTPTVHSNRTNQNDHILNDKFYATKTENEEFTRSRDSSDRHLSNTTLTTPTISNQISGISHNITSQVSTSNDLKPECLVLDDFEDEWDDFDDLVKDVDLCVFNEEVRSCPVCGLELPKGSTAQDLEQHTEICCPLEVIILD